MELLCNRLSTFEDVDPATPPMYHLEASHHVVEARGRANISIHINNGVRGTVLPDTGGLRLQGEGDDEAEAAAAVRDVQTHHACVAALRERLRKNMIKHHARPGDIWVFDNLRVLHGRAAFTPTSPRELEGGYFAWDDIDSLLRVAEH